MIPAENLLVFFAASVVLALAPGPDNLFVLAQAAQHGRAAGLFVTLGLCAGLLVHTAAVALGLAALLQTTPFAFYAIKLVGALYLLYLAWQAWSASAQKAERGVAPVLGRLALYRRGIFMNITNPKVSIFFLAFLPQFADPLRGSLGVQLGLLGGVFIAATWWVFGSIALLAGVLGQQLQRSVRWQRAINKGAAVIFVVLALKLLFEG